MKAVLISPDRDLCALCTEILNSFPACDWQLSVASAATRPADADLYIWDIQSGSDIPRDFDEGLSRHLFLVHRNDVAFFYQELGTEEATILLQPATRASLSAFLGLVASASLERASGASSLRADRDEMLQCLIQANLKLQEYDQDRTNFLARAVHDFRAPLTAASGYCGLLLGEALGEMQEAQKDVLRRMQHSVKRLSRMASAMFELSVGRQVKRQPELRKGEIGACLEQALHEINPFAEAKRISISVDLEPPAGTLYIEASQIEQLLINLLDNACKFTPRAGEIEIRGYPYFWERRSPRSLRSIAGDRRVRDCGLPNSYRIDISDSGPRIPVEHLEHIFEEYTSYGGGRDRSGGGLGLAICRMIVTLHNGKVWAENTEHGPRFSFIFPVPAADMGRTDSLHLETLMHTEAR